jgi:predicted transcriptional regulator
MFKEEILENERRHKIYTFIKANPGLYLRSLQKSLMIPLTSLQYHLNYMETRKIIYSEKAGNYIQYYCAAFNSREKEILSILRQRRLKQIVLLILTNKKIKCRALIDELELSPATISYYLKFLEGKGLVNCTRIGHEKIYTLRDEYAIAKTLVAHQESLFDKIVDKWLSTFIEKPLFKDKSP